MAINLGDVLESVAKVRADKPAVSDDTRTLSWSEFDKRSNALARALQSEGLQPNDKVAFLLFNSIEYLELLAACFKGRFVHANVNFRYTASEVSYVVENSDAAILVYDKRLHPVVDEIDPELKARVKLLPTGEVYEHAIASHDSAPLGNERSPQDQLFVYTGGTTGMPKGVMWTQDAQMQVLLAPTLGDDGITCETIIEAIDEPKTYLTPLIASPLMHALGLTAALTTFCNGGHIIVTDNSGGFDAGHIWDTVERHQADAIAIVGDAFAVPLYQALEEGEHDPSSVRVIGSSGVMWSAENKRDLLKHMPLAVMFDSLGSSEAMGIGTSATTAEGSAAPAKFSVSADTKVFTEDGEEVEPGSGVSGLLARGGHLPLGYYKDEAKTAETFRVFQGRRYSVPGDLCTVDADGTINLLGRGSQCINTAGEKVFPEEVEQALKQHDGIEDALVFGVPDPKWGQAVTAVILPQGEGIGDVDSLKPWLRQRLAGYKLPKTVVLHEKPLRLANGKPDYAAAKALVAS